MKKYCLVSDDSDHDYVIPAEIPVKTESDIQLDIGFWVDSGEINSESFEIENVLQGSFPLNHIELLKDSVLNDFDCSDMNNVWVKMRLEYTKDSETGDYYKSIEFPFTKLKFKCIDYEC